MWWPLVGCYYEKEKRTKGNQKENKEKKSFAECFISGTRQTFMFAECPLDDTRQRGDSPSATERRDTWRVDCRVPEFAEYFFSILPSAVVCRVFVEVFTECLIVCRVR